MNATTDCLKKTTGKQCSNQILEKSQSIGAEEEKKNNSLVFYYCKRPHLDIYLHQVYKSSTQLKN